MIIKNANTLYSVLFPLYFISKCCGLSPFSLNKIKFKKSKFNMALCLSFMCAVSIFLFIIPKEDVSAGGYMGDVTKNLTEQIDQYGIFINIFFGCIFSNNILKVLEFVEEFDNNFYEFKNDLKSQYKKFKVYSTVSILVTVISSILFGLAIWNNTYHTNLIIYDFVYNFLLSLVNMFVTLQFCTLVLIFKHRFAWLNETITDIFDKLENNSFGSLNSTPINDEAIPIDSEIFYNKVLFILEEIRKHHFQLCDYTKLLNMSYYAQILIILLNSFTIIVNTLYYSVRTTRDVEVVNHDFKFYIVCLLAFPILQILAISYSCSNTATEAKLTASLIHKLLNGNATITDKNREELQLEVFFFSLQIFHQNVQFTVCKLHVIDETLILSIIVTIVTYLVIVIQFEIQ